MSPDRPILTVAASTSEWSAPAAVSRSRERQRDCLLKLPHRVRPPTAVSRSRERQRVVRPPSHSWAA